MRALGVHLAVFYFYPSWVREVPQERTGSPHAKVAFHVIANFVPLTLSKFDRIVLSMII